MKKSTRVWTCDACGKRETWRKGWCYFPNVPSDKNTDTKLIYPWAVCSIPCEIRTYELWKERKMIYERPSKAEYGADK